MKRPELPPVPDLDGQDRGSAWVIWVPLGVLAAFAVHLLSYSPSYGPNCEVEGVRISQYSNETDEVCGTPDANQDFKKGGNYDIRRHNKGGSK